MSDPAASRARRTLQHLSARAVSKRFAGVDALTEVDVSVARGEFLGVIGPNGSGKSTLVNVLSGFLAPTSGQVCADDHEIAGWPPHRIARLGVGRTFQHTRLFGRLSVLENIEVAVVRARAWATGRERRRFAMAALEEMHVAEFAGRGGSDLSYGQQRKVEIARVLAAEPQFLLLDEPAAGVPQVERPSLAAAIAEAAARRDLGVLIIDHDLSFVTGLCKRTVVLDAGRVIAEGSSSEVVQDQRVIEAYIGTKERS